VPATFITEPQFEHRFLCGMVHDVQADQNRRRDPDPVDREFSLFALLTFVIEARYTRVDASRQDEYRSFLQWAVNVEYAAAAFPGDRIANLLCCRPPATWL
jgi:hypothetical protein